VHPRKWTSRDNRQELVAAALTLLRGFVVAGKPRLTPDRLASFEDWDDLVRQCVLWMAKQGIADLGDPTACIQATKKKEPERQKLAAFLEATAAVMEDEQWRVADLIRKAREADFLDSVNDSSLGALNDALQEIAGERGKINPRILGRWIERYADTRCAGYYLERCGTRQHAALWRIHTYASPDRPETNSQNSQNSPRQSPRRANWARIT